MEQPKINYREIMNKDRIINIPDVIRYILEKIWFLVILAVICAVGLAGGKYISDRQTVAGTEEGQVSETLEAGLTDTEISEVKAVLSLSENLDRQNEYLENSIYLQLNGLCEDRVTMRYEIGNTSEAWNVAELYKTYINNGGLVSDLQDGGADMEAQYLQELITATVGAESQLSLTDALTVTNEAGTITVVVMHESQEQCEALADQVADCLQAFYDTAAASVGTHEFTLSGRYYAQVVDEDIWKKVEDYTNRISTENSRLSSMQSALSDQQNSLLTLYLAENAADEEETSDFAESSDSETALTGSTPTISKKYMAVGALGGIVLGIVLLILWYILRGTVNCVQELQGMYNLRILGEIGARKGLFTHKADESSQLELLAANIQSVCKRNACSRVLFVDAVSDKPWIATLCMKLKEHGIEMETVANLSSPELYGRFAECNQIILGENLMRTKHEDLRQEIRICLEHQVDILGTVACY